MVINVSTYLHLPSSTRTLSLELRFMMCQPILFSWWKSFALLVIQKYGNINMCLVLPVVCRQANCSSHNTLTLGVELYIYKKCYACTLQYALPRRCKHVWVVCMCVCVCVWEREWERERERERVSVCECVSVCERESACVWERESERERVRVCVWEIERERVMCNTNRVNVHLMEPLVL